MMPRPRSTNLPNSALLLTLMSIGAVWVASDIGYYFLLPALDQKSSYNDGPIAATLYYVFWVGLVVIVFWPQYARWSHHARWGTFKNRLVSALIWSTAFASSVAFIAYVLPALPQFDWRETWNPPELPLATTKIDRNSFSAIAYCSSDYCARLTQIQPTKDIDLLRLPIRSSTSFTRLRHRAMDIRSPIFGTSIAFWFCVSVSDLACAEWLRLFVWCSLGLLCHDRHYGAHYRIGKPV